MLLLATNHLLVLALLASNSVMSQTNFFIISWLFSQNRNPQYLLGVSLKRYVMKKYPRIVKLAKNTNGNGQVSKEVGQNGGNPRKKEAMSPSKENSKEQANVFWGNMGEKW